VVERTKQPAKLHVKFEILTVVVHVLIPHIFPKSNSFCRILFCRSRTTAILEEDLSFSLPPCVVSSCVHQWR